MKILELSKNIHEANVQKGWWDDATNGLPLKISEKIDRYLATEKLALIHSEVTEALEVIRDHRPFNQVWHGDQDKPEGFGIELADTIIRILDLAYACDIDLEKMILEKLKYNETRPYRHGGKSM